MVTQHHSHDGNRVVGRQIVVVTQRLHFEREFPATRKATNTLFGAPPCNKNSAQDRRKERGEGEDLFGGQSAAEREQHSLDGGVGGVAGGEIERLLCLGEKGLEIFSRTLVLHWDRHERGNAVALIRSHRRAGV